MRFLLEVNLGVEQSNELFDKTVGCRNDSQAHGLRLKAYL